MAEDVFDELFKDKRIVVSEKKKNNRKKCYLAGSDWQAPLEEGHIIIKADCFMHYHPLINEYISSRIQ